MSRIYESLQRFLHLSREALNEHIGYSDARIVLFGTFGIVAFPAYGLIWTQLYPQPYESMGLRLLMSLICVGVALRHQWPTFLVRYWEPFWWFAAMVTLPMFFTYMLFMNQFTPVWGMSVLAASIILVQLVDWRNYLILHSIGAGAAYLLYALSTGTWDLYTVPQTDGIGAFIAVLVFAVGTGVLFNLTEPGFRLERARATVDTSQRLAHELRTSLTGVNINAVEIGRHLPVLIEGYRKAQQAELVDSLISDRKLEAIERGVEDVAGESKHGLDTISLLLANAQPHTVKPQSDAVSVAQVAETVMEKRSRVPREYRWMELTIESDFSIYLPRAAVRNLFDNLINNAARAIYKARRESHGRLQIRVDGESRTITIRDNGSGIDPVDQGMVFRKYFTTSADSSEGSGLGLHYCKNVVEEVGGTIRLESRPGEGTAFILSFPERMHVESGLPEAAG